MADALRIGPSAFFVPETGTFGTWIMEPTEMRRVDPPIVSSLSPEHVELARVHALKGPTEAARTLGAVLGAKRTTLYRWTTPGDPLYWPEYHEEYQRQIRLEAQDVLAAIERDGENVVGINRALAQTVVDDIKSGAIKDAPAKDRAAIGKSVAQGMREGYRLLGAPLGIEIDRPQTIVNVNASASASALSSASASIAVPFAQSMDDFLARDMGIDAREVYPRVLWLLRQIDRDQVRLVLLKAGKGSGKGFVVHLTLARQAQKTLALANPSLDLGLASGEKLGIANLSGSGEQQAQLAIFHGLKRDLERAPWFRQHAPVDAAKAIIELPKDLVCVSGNSSSKEFEGVCLVAAGADEVPRMETMDASGGQEHAHVKALVEPVLATFISRVPRFYKMLLAGWPEHAADWLTKECKRRIEVEGAAEDLTTAFLASPLTRGNEDQEQARRKMLSEPPFCDYPTRVVLTTAGTLVVECPTWQMKPDADLDALRGEARLNPTQFARMFGAHPQRASSSPFVADVDAIRRGADPTMRHPFDDDALHAAMARGWTDAEEPGMVDAVVACMLDGFVCGDCLGTGKKKIGETEKDCPTCAGQKVGKPRGSGAHLYYGRIDLGISRDACGIAVAHREEGRIAFDLLLELRPQAQAKISMRFVRAIFKALVARGFDFDLVEFDAFEGQANMELFASAGFRCEIKSVDRRRGPYETWKRWHLDGNLRFYAYEPYFACCADLVDLGRKIDHVSGGCFAADTRIPLLDGTFPTIAELDGKEVWVYSCAPDGRVVPGKARGRKTFETAELLDVVLDSGAIVRCTPDHRFMTLHGRYVEAQLLRPGIDRLMPFRRSWPVNGGYEECEIGQETDPDATTPNGAARILKCGRNVVMRVMKEFGFPDWASVVAKANGGGNHKVRALIPVHLDAPACVYDLEVDEWCNFGLCAGVFVHNSKDVTDAAAGLVSTIVFKEFGAEEDR